MMKHFLIFNLITLFLTTLSLANTLKSSSGEVKFTAIGKPGFLKINGQSNGKYPTGTANFNNGKADGEFEFTLKEFNTGINLRDEHMKNKYLEIGKFPTAKLAFKDISIKDSNSDYDGTFNGNLTLHGVTKPVSGKVKYTGKDKKIVANFSVKVSDFQIPVPKYLGVTVSESVDIESTINLN